MLGHLALAVLVQLSVTMTIKKGGDLVELPSGAGDPGSRVVGESREGGRCVGEDVKVSGALCSLFLGHKLGKIRLRPRKQFLSWPHPGQSSQKLHKTLLGILLLPAHKRGACL